MDVVGLIGMLMVPAMVGGPPEGTALHGGIAEESKEKLPRPGGLETFVGEIAVIEAGHGEHADGVEQCRDDDGGPAPSHPENSQDHEMRRQKGNHPEPVDFIGSGGQRLALTGVGVKPPENRQEH